MSGHSKWSKIKHKKEANDAQKGKSFSKFSKEITLAVREGGGGDVNFNFQLRAVIDRAKFAKMPLSSIENAIAKGMGAGKEGVLEKILYEAYFSGGIALLIECLTDNKNRTVADVRMALRRNDAELASSGSVLWQFDKIGRIEIIDNNSVDELLEKLIEINGVIDIREEDSVIVVITKEDMLQQVREHLERVKINVSSASLEFQAKEKINADNVDSLINLLESLDSLDDVINIWHNAVIK